MAFFICSLWVVLGVMLWFKLYPNGFDHDGDGGLFTVVLFLITWPFCTVWAIVDVVVHRKWRS